MCARSSTSRPVGHSAGRYSTNVHHKTNTPLRYELSALLVGWLLAIATVNIAHSRRIGVFSAVMFMYMYMYM